MSRGSRADVFMWVDTEAGDVMGLNPYLLRNASERAFDGAGS